MMDRLVPIARQCLFFFNWCWTLGVDELDFCARIKELSENKSHFVGTAEVGPCNQQALRLYHAFVCFFPEKISSFPNFQERVVFTFKGELMQAMKDASKTLAKVGPGFHQKEATSQWPVFTNFRKGHSLERPAEASAGRSETLEKSR